MHKIGFNVFKKHWAETRNKTPSFLDVSRHRSNSENHLQGSWQSEERLEHSWCQGFQTSMEKRIYSLFQSMHGAIVELTTERIQNSKGFVA